MRKKELELANEVAEILVRQFIRQKIELFVWIFLLGLASGALITLYVISV